MRVFLREGSTSKNLKDLLPLVNQDNIDRFVFCTDDRHPKDLLEEGHIDYMVRLAIEHGIAPALAVRMASLNAARHFGLENIGAIAPGYEADLLVLDDLDSCRIGQVYKGGVLVAEQGEVVYEPPKVEKIHLRSSINVKELSLEDFRIPADGSTANVIGLIPNQLITEHLREEVASRDGEVVGDLDSDILKIFVVERHHASDNIGRGLVKGLGLKRGAMASSVAHDSHNIIATGVSDEDIFAAVLGVVKLRGGLVVVSEGKTLASLALPIGGLMSDQPLADVEAQLKELHDASHQLGASVEDPLAALSFLGLTVIPALKLSDLGLVDVNAGRVIGLFEETGSS
jgi:adenine deaminase